MTPVDASNTTPGAAPPPSAADHGRMIGEIGGRLTSLERVVTSGFDAADRRMESLAERERDTSGELVAVTTQLRSLADAVKTLNGTVNGLSHTIQTELRTQATALAGFREDLNSLRADRARDVRDRERLDARLAAAEAALAARATADTANTAADGARRSTLGVVQVALGVLTLLGAISAGFVSYVSTRVQEVSELVARLETAASVVPENERGEPASVPESAPEHEPAPAADSE